MTYLEEMYTGLWNFVVNYYWQYYELQGTNITSGISKLGIFPPSSFLVIFSASK